MSAAPILECTTVANTSITADTTLKFLLKSRVNTAMLSAAGVPIEGTAFVQDAPGSFVNDYDFVVALIEQDSFASLRYGVLFLLALSSLGVYSIILAG
jgi:NADH:ubiquinone oxidoreductase subunit H